MSCNFLQKKEASDAVARVGDDYLYREDLDKLFNERHSREDSAIIVDNFINNWAKKRLLIEKAKINLDQDRVDAFEVLIDEYRADLYSNAYEEALVSREMDTLVPFDDMELYYRENKENFKLNEELIKLRYIQLDKEFSNLIEVKERLARFNNEDQGFLEDLSLQFHSFSFNDSVWVKTLEFIQKVPILTADNKNRYLKKSQFFELTDSLEVYLVQVEDILKRNETAPLEYILPTVQQIILNRRKLEFIRNLEKDLINEAIQKKQFEIYDKN